MIAAAFLAAWAALPTPVVAQDAPDVSAGTFERGVEAYRRGDHEEAAELWRSLLDEPRARADRARLLYDLGNAAWRSGEEEQALGWFTACVRVDPRNADAWHNLEHVRAELELEPADRGDLRSTALRLVRSVTPAERAWGVIGASLALSILLLGEALRGGPVWRALSLVGVGGVVVAAIPWVAGDLGTVGDPVLTLQTPFTQLRAEPDRGLSVTGHLDPGVVVERIDALPGWVRVEGPEGERGWTPEDAVFELER